MARSSEELKAMAYSLADEIETRAQARIDAGLDRDKAIMLTVAEMSGKITVARG
jgi:hypothetical protein